MNWLDMFARAAIISGQKAIRKAGASLAQDAKEGLEELQSILDAGQPKQEPPRKIHVDVKEVK